MKKLSLILSAILLMGSIALTACGEKDNGADKDTTPETKTESNIDTSADTSAESETVAETEPAVATVDYTITVKDQDGNPVEGARVMICEVGKQCLLPVKTDASGVAVYNVPEAIYQAKFAALPDGYTGNMEYIDFPADSRELVIVVTKG